MSKSQTFPKGHAALLLCLLSSWKGWRVYLMTSSGICRPQKISGAWPSTQGRCANCRCCLNTGHFSAEFICRNKRSIQENIHPLENLKYETSEPPTGNVTECKWTVEKIQRSCREGDFYSIINYGRCESSLCTRPVSAHTSMLSGGKTTFMPYSICSPSLNKLSLV